MRFKADIQNIKTFTRFTAALESLGPFAWVQLNTQDVRFTVIPEQGSQVWANPSVLEIDAVFGTYLCEAAADNTINLEVPISPLHTALKSAHSASSASIRLTKRDSIPVLCLTITTSSVSTTSLAASGGFRSTSTQPVYPEPIYDAIDANPNSTSHRNAPAPAPAGIDMTTTERETVITQSIPVRVLPASALSGIHEPRVREPDVHIVLPALPQLKAASERFTRLAAKTGSSSSSSGGGGGGVVGATAVGPRLEMAANMHGCLRMRVVTEASSLSCLWTGLVNPELQGAAEQHEQEDEEDEDEEDEEGESERDYEGAVGKGNGKGKGDRRQRASLHPSARMKLVGDKEGRSEEGWARVRIDGRDWSKVMSVGRLGAERVIACFCDDHALILYVYLTGELDDVDGSVLTYYVSSYSA